MSEQSATVAEFILFTGYRHLDEMETERIHMLLEQAKEQITSYLGTSNWATPGDVVAGLESDNGNIAKGRQLHMVRRYYDNSKGLTSESFDGLSVSMDDRAYEGLRLTPYDKQVLDRNRKKTSKVQTLGRHRNNGRIW